jgi:hypothetical protein
MPELAALLNEIISKTTRGESLLDDGIIDIALDQFIDIRKLAKQAKEKIGAE